VSFETKEQATKALEAEGIDVMGRSLRVKSWLQNPPAWKGDDNRGGFDGGRRGGRDGRAGGRDGRGRRGGRGGRDDRGGRDGGRGGRGGRGSSEKVPGTTTVYVGNLPYTVTDDQMHETFGDCGTIENIRWVEKEGRFMGCGFIKFAETEATDKALEKSGLEIGGRAVRVDFATSKN